MATYANGRIPANKLIWFTSGNEKFRSTPATVARWNSLVAEVRALHGVTLVITSGPNAYRDYNQQVAMREYYTERGDPLRAALPGTSSHGGSYSGAFTGWVTKDSMAIDVNNWAAIGWDEFKRLCNKHGFEVDVVIPHESWHIVDFAPWTMPETEAAASNATPLPTTIPARKKRMTDMHICYIDEKVIDVPGIAGVRNATYKTQRTFIHYGPGYYRELTRQAEANGIASQIGANAFAVTADERAAIKAATGK